LRALRYELQRKGVSHEIIERAISSVDVSEGAYRVARKKARRLQGEEERAFYRKLMDYLARRGFDYGLAREVTDHYWRELTGGGEGYL
jgi:SOS response regulatory protein OraA/RecX